MVNKNKLISYVMQNMNKLQLIEFVTCKINKIFVILIFKYNNLIMIIIQQNKKLHNILNNFINKIKKNKLILK